MTGVAHIPYLEARKSGFFFRRRMPARLASVNLDSDNFLCLSLRTHVPGDAKDLARRLTALCDLAFALGTETRMKHLGTEDIRLLEELARFQIDAHAAARAMAPPRSEAAAHQAAACEQATQDVLRRALACGDREVVRAPLRAVAERLGVHLAEDTESWRMLAYEATRILLDVSRERENRELGRFDTPSPIFVSARAARGAASNGMPGNTASIRTAATPAPIASPAPPGTPPRVAAAAVAHGVPAPGTPTAPLICTAVEAARPGETTARPRQEEPSPSPASASQAEAPVEIRAAATLGDEAAIRAKMRPPRLENIDLRDLSEKSRMALASPRGITVIEAIRLYRELKEAGYGNEFAREQTRDADAGRNWQKDSASKIRFAETFWPEFVGDVAFEDASKNDIRDALAFLPRIPAKHGKGQERYLAENGYRELIERIDSDEETDAEANLHIVASRPDATEADKEQARREALQPRLRSETIIKHRRTLRAVGQMLYDLQLIDKNPFEICSVSNSDKKRMAAKEASRARTVWDDRILTLFHSPVFQGEIDDPGEPLFWLPLLARLMGFREEEACQLAPEDFGSDRNIPYVDIKRCDANHVKSDESQRKVPVHPQLIELGLLRLVEMRRRQGQSRLFPNLTRGQTKGKFSENFSKKFTYYRQTNECYWPGLDFHAFRTTFHGDLMNRDKSDAIRCRLMGHEPRDEGDRSYSQGLHINVLLERIRDVEIDISMIRSPFSDAPSEARKKAETQGLRVVG